MERFWFDKQGAIISVNVSDCGINVENVGKEDLSVEVCNGGLKSFEAITLPYPGFPTDLQAQTCALACRATGLSILTERVYPSRFMHVPELLRMGAEISLEGTSAIVRGGKPLTGAPVRQGQALFNLAGLRPKERLGFKEFITLIADMIHLKGNYNRWEPVSKGCPRAKCQRLFTLLPLSLDRAC